MTLILTFEDAGKGKTKYTARALHWSAEDCAAHEKMGFDKGWTQCHRAARRTGGDGFETPHT